MVEGERDSDARGKAGSAGGARLVGCGCTYDSFRGLKRAVARAGASLRIRCFKRSTLVITREGSDAEAALEKFYISLEPEMSFILNVLEPEWIAHMLAVDEARWVSSQTSKGASDSHPVSAGSAQDTYTTEVSRTRRSSSVIFEHFEDATIARVEQRVALIAGIDVRYLEKLVMVRYFPGDYFKTHHDGAFRSHTLLLYLNGGSR